MCREYQQCQGYHKDQEDICSVWCGICDDWDGKPGAYPLRDAHAGNGI